jgi:hypothetical protein
MIPASVRIFVCREPMDLRRSFDGLALAAKERLGESPQSGALFCFLNTSVDVSKAAKGGRLKTGQRAGAVSPE